MGVLLIALLAGVLYLVAYHTYGRWLGVRIFALSAGRVCPSREMEDGQDYVPTGKSIVFGHHFTSIAGTGPIVGPAIAVMWGWLPALLWVLFGSIFIGAVHDFGALVVSLRNRGQTVGDISGRVLNSRVRLLFLLVLFLALTLVLGIFGLVIAAVFRMYPASILPCLVQIPIALIIGTVLHRKGVSILVPSILALTVMYLTVVFGDAGPLHAINMWLASWPIFTWVIVLLVYAYIASVLPVWSLLQPRDYINSLQLISALGLVVIGLVVAALMGGMTTAGERAPLELVAPMVQWSPVNAPWMFPFLFITIACGAISGFHCLVSSGTSSKQLANEQDAQFVGYGGMLLEGFLAVIVILACTAGLGLGWERGDFAGLGGEALWASVYGDWNVAGNGLGITVGAFVAGSANFLTVLGVPGGVALALMGVLVASFAGTTLDTACRLQRYVIQELAATLGGADAPVEDFEHVEPKPAPGWLAPLRNKHGATILAIAVAAVIAAVPLPGQDWSYANAGAGGKILWPLFGATNQLLGGLAFLVLTFWLWRRGLPTWFVVLPLVFMLIMPAWAMSMQIRGWLESGQWLLVLIAGVTLLLEAWMIVEAVLLWPRVKGVKEVGLPPLRAKA